MAVAEAWWGACAALGGGLLVGLERERRKGRGPGREAAGVRSFTLACGAGALAQALAQPLLVAAGALAVVLLAVAAYWKSRSADPGLTTELALVATYFIGVLAMQQPAAGAAAAVLLALLLALREPLHRLSTRLLTDDELHDGLLLAALAGVLLPLLPAGPAAWLGGASPRALLGLAVLILAVQALGHLALRLFGPRAGLVLGGAVGGFVSSTATVAAMGARARAEPALARGCAAAAVMSSAATWVLAMLILLGLAPAVAQRLLPAALAGTLVAVAAGAWLARAPAGLPGPRGAAEAAPGGPLRVKEALLVALGLTLVSLAAGWARRQFGEAGALAAAGLAALADTHAAVAALGAMARAGTLAPAAAAQGVLLAVAANSLTRGAVALATGGGRYAARVAGTLATSLAAAGAAAWFGVDG